MEKALYFLAVIPPDSLEKELYALKQKLSEQYQTFSALKSPSHITVLAPFWLENDQRRKIVKVLHQVAGVQAPFNVHLNGYDCFGERTLYIGVESSIELAGLHEDLKRLVENVQDEPFSARSFVPHLTLLNRDITPENFRKVWQEYSVLSYQAKFEVSALSLLELKGQRWEIVEVFTFR